MAGAFEGFRVDSDGVRELLLSTGFATAVHEVVEQVAATARGAARRVTSGESLPVEVFDDPGRDRVGTTVAVPHPAGMGMEARYGLLKRSAEAAGLEVAGLESGGEVS
ncbi:MULTISPECIES: hypothetical protein [Actinosynnema]|uniref:hypothetical protein n=1 Tax=Actinosynnema TaxID=40566 RepID=UPI0020A58BAA|nr:hypothetical protein [Actinosynnema pretiosum]MCP2092662.1 hypothetical protein [Actinosynnema pretiosum]